MSLICLGLTVLEAKPIPIFCEKAMAFEIFIDQLSRFCCPIPELYAEKALQPLFPIMPRIETSSFLAPHHELVRRFQDALLDGCTAKMKVTTKLLF